MRGAAVRRLCRAHPASGPLTARQLQPGVAGTDTPGMLFDLLALGLVVAGYLVGRRRVSARAQFVLMPVEDQPPAAVDDPLPSARALDRYVEHGLSQLDAYVAARHPGPGSSTGT